MTVIVADYQKLVPLLNHAVLSKMNSACALHSPICRHQNVVLFLLMWCMK